MGKSLKRLKIIEFNGLPGSGKTTVSENLIRDLRNKDYKVIEYTIIYRKLKQRKLTILRILFFIRFIHFRYLYCCMRTLTPKDLLKVSNIKIILDSFYHFLLLSYCKKKYRNYDYIILDQGIMQNWLSISYTKEIKSINCIEKFNKKLFLFLSNYLIVNTNIGINETVNRLIFRKKGTSRLDKLNKSEAKEIATIQLENLNKLREISFFYNININTEDGVESNVKKIISLL